MEIRVETRERHTALVTIDNEPRRNAMTRAMLGEIAALWDRLDDVDCRCVVSPGPGGRAFTSGADRRRDMSADEAARGRQPGAAEEHDLLEADRRRGQRRLRRRRHGAAALDRHPRRRAGARFGLPEVKWSIYPFGGAT